MKNSILLLGAFLTFCSAEAEPLSLPASDARFAWSDCVGTEVAGTGVWFTRAVLRHGGKYVVDSPCGRFRFRCNAAELSVELLYGERNAPVRAHNSVGVFLIDGEGREAWCFHRANIQNREPESVMVHLPADGRMHDYELVMPYAERAGVCRVVCNVGTAFQNPSPRPVFRCAFFGDSVTHGFTASRIDRCYPYRVGILKNWQVLNVGLGGIGISPRIAADLSNVDMDRLIVALGVNDWQGGTDPERSKANMLELLRTFRRAKPDVPVTVVTPLWVPPSWKPAKARFELDAYRKAIVQAVAACGDMRIAVVAGDTLIDHDPALFDKVAVHPNDRGFAQMAERLANALPPRR